MTDPAHTPEVPDPCRPLNMVDLERLRQQHPDLWMDPNNACITCNKQPVFRARYQGEVQDMVCNCVNQWLMHLWMHNSGIGTHYQRLSWSDVTHVPQNVVDEVFDYLDHAEGNLTGGHGLTLWSPSKGTGKTMLLTLVLKRLLREGYRCYFVTFQDMLDYYTGTWRNADERAWFVRKVRNAQVLAIDDIGRESKGRENITEAMFDQVLRPRVAADTPTLISTNFTPEQMYQGYGGNVLSLLSQANHKIEVPGADFRPIQRQQADHDILHGVRRPLVVG